MRVTYITNLVCTFSFDVSFIDAGSILYAHKGKVPYKKQQACCVVSDVQGLAVFQ